MKASVCELKPKFVEFIPKELDAGVIYVSGEFATTAHLCACGCGERVVLPLHPTDWKLKFDGQSITMRPSVGNWSFECRSHYLITRNQIEWAGQWSKEQISHGRGRDMMRKAAWHDSAPDSSPKAETKHNTEAGWFARVHCLIKRWLARSD